jgi:hypothetical protein
VETYLLSTAPIPTTGPTQHNLQWVTEDFLPVIRQLRHKDDQAPAPTAKFSNTWRITSSPQSVSTARRLIKAHGHITFTSDQCKTEESSM